MTPLARLPELNRNPTARKLADILWCVQGFPARLNPVTVENHRTIADVIGWCIGCWTTQGITSLVNCTVLICLEWRRMCREPLSCGLEAGRRQRSSRESVWAMGHNVRRSKNRRPRYRADRAVEGIVQARCGHDFVRARGLWKFAGV